MVPVGPIMDLLGDQAVLQNHALQGKTALICGASRGIGAATARIMAKAGANVILASRNEEQLNSLFEELSNLGNGHHQTLVMDLENTEAIAGGLEPILDKGPIHILINNVSEFGSGKWMVKDKKTTKILLNECTSSTYRKSYK